MTCSVGRVSPGQPRPPAVLPFYLPMVGVDLRALRVFRLMRLVRRLKLGRYPESLRHIGRVAWKKREELGATLFIVFVLQPFSLGAGRL